MIKVEKSLLIEGLEEEEKYLKLTDVFLDEKTYIHYAEINKIQKKENNHLILIHGFGGNMFAYFKMIKYLKEYFFITLLDIPGQGFNYRDPELKKINTIEDWILYFVETLNKFFEKMKYEKFILGGHSKGGYISAHYTKKYPEKIQMLYLISPAGFSRFEKDELKKLEERYKNMPWFKKTIFGYVKNKIFVEKKSPFDFYIFPFRGFVLDKYLNNKRFNYNKKEKNRIRKLMHYFFTQPQYSERSLGYVLHYAIKSEMPIFEALKDMKQRHIDMFIYYGESDWMDSSSTQKLIRENKLDICVEFISNSDHQIVVQNAQELSQKMINHYYQRLQDKKIQQEFEYQQIIYCDINFLKLI